MATIGSERKTPQEIFDYDITILCRRISFLRIPHCFTRWDTYLANVRGFWRCTIVSARLLEESEMYQRGIDVMWERLQSLNELNPFSSKEVFVHYIRPRDMIDIREDILNGEI